MYFPIRHFFWVSLVCWATGVPLRAVPVKNDTLPGRSPVYLQDKGPYRPSRTKVADILHMELHVKPDWSGQRLAGNVLLTIKPYFYPQDVVELDARGFEIGEVFLLEKAKGSGKKQPLPYTYDDRLLKIRMGRQYTRHDTLYIGINYTADPRRLVRKEGESRAPERGLYFVNPLGLAAGKPRQLWTQGETDGSSTWFPTIDSPNEKFTQEIRITVEDRLVTLSNGLLVKQERHPDGTRTDQWKQGLPHAPYLAMIAAGDFATVTDAMPDGLPLAYYVEPGYAKYAKAIFGRTPEMITFFSERFGTPYPWEKYAQIAVRDFVTGAMENTTATVHEEDIQADNRQLLDGNSDAVIAHELAHQWFGNLVTCEEWGQLPLNEAFANYGEYLWAEYKYGAEEAEWAGQLELQQYLTEAREKKVPMIRYFYKDAGEMFDSHSYARGGRVLHMLRKYVGDEAFFLALKTYLKKNRFGTAELADLRMAFEEVTGEDLNWFFDQWFLRPGHPVLEVRHTFDPVHRQVRLNVRQLQDTLSGTLYRLPLKIGIYNGQEKKEYAVTIEKQAQEFHFTAGAPPDLVYFDTGAQLLGEVDHRKSARELAFQFGSPEGFTGSYLALQALAEMPPTEQTEAVFKDALHHPFWKIRQEAVQRYTNLAGRLGGDPEKRIAGMVLSDPSPLVRAEAVATLAGLRSGRHTELFRGALADSSYSVVAAALDACFTWDPKSAPGLIASYGNTSNAAILSAVGNYYGDYPQAKYLEWFVEKLGLLSASGKYRLLQAMGKYLVKSDAAVRKRSVPFLERMARSDPSYYVRFGAYQLLGWLDDQQGVKEIRRSIRAAAEEPKLLELLRQLDGM